MRRVSTPLSCLLKKRNIFDFTTFSLSQHSSKFLLSNLHIFFQEEISFDTNTKKFKRK